jgi:DNA modification methylase
MRTTASDMMPNIQMRPPGSLRPNPRNARTHSKKQIRQLANSIKAAGFIGAVVVDETDMVLAGHARLAACKLLEMHLVPTLTVAGLSEAQKRAFVIADNKIPENAGWDRELLVLELGELAELLPALNLDVTVTGFEPAEIDMLFADQGSPKPDPEDEFPMVAGDAITRSGDLWCLGQHRLLCGDARSRADLDRLMNDARAQMIFADPPYNVRIASVQGRGRIKHQEFAFASGEMSEQEYVAFLQETLSKAARVSVEGAVHYVCVDWRHIAELIAAGRLIYGAMLNLCVWTKSNPGQGSFYRSQHELIGVFRVGNVGHQNNVDLGRFGRNRTNVWLYPGVSGFGAGRQDTLAMHPTVKPIALVADAMRDCTTKGDVVLDPFLGSGTTILAAEKIGRRAYGLEFEPRYVDVAIPRWEAYTKAEAVLEGDGRTYAEIKAERLSAAENNSQRSAAPPDTAKEEDISASPGSDGGSDWIALCDAVAVTPTAGGDK